MTSTHFWRLCWGKRGLGYKNRSNLHQTRWAILPKSTKITLSLLCMSTFLKMSAKCWRSARRSVTMKIYKRRLQASRSIDVARSCFIGNASQPQYGMLIHYFSGQTVMPTYTDPIMSIPGSANISQKNELVLHVSQVPPRNSIPPIDPISDEMFDQYVQHWQNRQRSVGPTSQSNQTGSPQQVRPVVAIGPTGYTVPN